MEVWKNGRPHILLVTSSPMAAYQVRCRCQHLGLLPCCLSCIDCIPSILIGSVKIFLRPTWLGGLYSNIQLVLGVDSTLRPIIFNNASVMLYQLHRSCWY